MRLAVVLAPTDPQAGDAVARREALLRLRELLANQGFKVRMVGGGTDPATAVERAAVHACSGDTVVVHVSGRWLRPASLAFGGGQALALESIAEIFLARKPHELAFIAELMHDEEGSDETQASECAAAIVAGLAGPTRQNAVLAAVRPLRRSSGRLSFTERSLAQVPAPSTAPAAASSLLDGMAAHAHVDRDVQSVARMHPGAAAPMIDRREPVAIPAPVLDDPPATAVVPAMAAEVAVVPAMAAEVAVVPAMAAEVAVVPARTRDLVEPSPHHPSLAIKNAFAAEMAAGNTDKAFLAAMTLAELNVADADQRALIERFRSVAPVRAVAPLDQDAWSLLRAPGFDDVLASLLAAIGPAAVSVRLDDLSQQGRVPPIDRDRRLSETSTASIVRSFQWAARFLAMACPDLYVADDASGIEPIPSAVLSTCLGPNALSGPSARDLAFLAGRHLTHCRPEYRVLFYYPTREDVTMLLFAAVQMKRPNEHSDRNGAIGSLRMRLERRLGDRERAALADAVERLDARGGKATIGAWMRSAELTAARVGLLLCGDLATAAALVGSNMCRADGVALALRRADLVEFCASKAHAELRARFVALDHEASVAVPLADLRDRAAVAQS